MDSRRICALLGLLACWALSTSSADAATGDLTFQSCFSDANASIASCTPVPGAAAPLAGAAGVAVSPNGGSVYATGLGRAFEGEPFTGSLGHFVRGSDGALTFSDCFGDDATNGCNDLPATPLDRALDVVVRPDGTGVYVASFGSDSISHFFVNSAGLPIYDGCISNTNADSCAVASAPNVPLDGASSMAFRPDGKTLYVVSQEAETISRIEVQPGGQLVYGACYSNTGTNGCVDLPGSPLIGVAQAAVSPDGNSLYVVADGQISRFSINVNGVLTFKDCVDDNGCDVDLPQTPLGPGTSIAVDAGNVYAAGDNLLHFFRGADGSMTYDGCIGSVDDNCAPGGSTKGQLALSPDGGSLYSSSFDTMRINQYLRSPQGQLAFQRCYSSSGDEGACVQVPAPFFPTKIAFSPDSAQAYVTDMGASALIRFSRESGSAVEPDPPTSDPTTPLVLNLDAKAKQKAKKLNATATCSIACSLTLSAKGKADGDKFSSKSTTLDLQAAAPTKVRLSFKRKVLNAIAGDSGKATFIATASDTSGAQTDTESAKAKLK